MARRNSSRIVVLAAALVVCAAAAIAFRGVGRWLVREDPPGPTQVIVVLSGGLPARAEEAANIFRRGDAHEVWVTRPEAPVSELAEMGIRYLGEEEYSREVLVHEGVPEADIRVLPAMVVNTEQEVQEVANELVRERKTSVTIVTSPQHTRRVRTLWRKLGGNSPRLIVRAAWQDHFDADHWWRDTHDAFSVVREILGLLNAWAGLRVRPHPL